VVLDWLTLMKRRKLFDVPDVMVMVGIIGMAIEKPVKYAVVLELLGSNR